MTDPYPKIRRRKRLEKDDQTKMLEGIARFSADQDAKEVAAKLAANAAAKAKVTAEAKANAEAQRTAEPEKPTQQETLPPSNLPTAKLPRIIDPWANLNTIDINEKVLAKNHIITASRNDPAHTAFDVLRARMTQAMANNGWTRVAITSPTPGCGKTFVAVNLAVALSRYANSNTILLDLDMRTPDMASVIGAAALSGTGDFLRGLIPPEDYLQKFSRNALNIGANLAIGLNDRAEAFSSELADDPSTAENLSRLERELAPEVVIFDMPPALTYDDVIAYRPHFDAVLLVISGDRTKAQEVREVMRRLGDDCPLLGVILNKSEDSRDDLQWV